MRTFSPDAKTLAIALFSGGIELWDWRQKGTRPDGVLRGHSNYATHLAFLSKGEALASAGADGVVRIWDMRTKKERGILPTESKTLECMAVSSDERTIVVGDRVGTVRLLRSATEEEIQAAGW